MKRYLFPVKWSCLLAVILILSGCLSQGQKDKTPLQRFISIAAMDTAVKLDFKVPTWIPKGYIQTSCYAIEGKTIVLFYSNGERSAFYRTGKGGEPLGTEKTFDTEQAEAFAGFTVTVHFNQADGPDAPCLVLWQDGKTDNALEGFTREEALDYILSLELVSKTPDADWIARPEIPYDSPEALSKAVDAPVYRASPGETLPGGYKATGEHYAIGSVIGVAKYSHDTDTLLIFSSKGSAAADSYFDGDVKDTLAIGELSGSTVGRKELLYTASWEQEGCSYQIRSASGMSLSLMTEIVSTVSGSLAKEGHGA